jgi:hypothetical protein
MKEEEKRSESNGQFARKEIELSVRVHRKVTQPLGELAEHQPSGNVGAVDRGLRSAGALVGFLRGEERGRVVLSAPGITRHEHTKHFSTHPAVAEEAHPVLHRAPDQPPGLDTVHAAEEDVSCLCAAPEALWQRLHLELLDEEQAFWKTDDPAVRARIEAQAAALRGKRGGQILAFAAGEGKMLAAFELGAMPTFDGMAAARGRLYLTTVDGKVLCLGGEGTPLGEVPDAKLAPLDTAVHIVPAAAPPAGPRRGPSLAGEFAQVVAGEVTRSDLGYHLSAGTDKAAVAIKKLPQPLTGKVVLTTQMRITADGKLKNGFVVFGDGPQEADLVKCGLRLAMKKAVIVQGPIAGGQVAAQPFEAELDKAYPIEITVDTASGAVTMRSGQTTVTAQLVKPLARISTVGFCTLNSAADFSSVHASVP